jgi:hypothetical protein
MWRDVPPDRFEYADRCPRWAAFGGLLLIAVAGFVLYLAWHGPELPARWAGSASYALGLTAALAVFLILGLIMAFGRWGFRLDRDTQSLTRWWNVLVPIWRRRYPLTQFRRIGVSWLPPTSDSMDESSFWVTLAGSGKTVRLALLRDLRDARALAKDLAEFLRLPVADKTLGRIEV